MIFKKQFPKFKRLNNFRPGFALIELLIAVTIFAVIATVIYTTFYTGIKAYRRAQSELSANRQINQVLDRLSLELRNCYDAEYDERDEQGGFIAAEQSVSFFTLHNTYTQDGPGKALARFSYSFRDGKLFKKMQIDKDVFLDTAEFSEEELLRDIQKLSFQYLYFKKAYQEEEHPYEWKPQWIDKTIIPLGVRVEIVKLDPKDNIQINLKRDIFLSQGIGGAQE